MKSRGRLGASSRGGGRLTAEQQLALQKKEKRGVKARKELQADETRLREEAELERNAEFMALSTRQEEEVGTTRARLISRLSTNLDELRATTSKTIATQDAALQALMAGVTSLCNAMNDAKIVPVPTLDLIRQGKSGKELGNSIAELGVAIAGRVRDNETTARNAEAEISIMREALFKAQQQVAAAEAIIASRHVRATTEYSTAAELLRERGAAFEQRFARLEEERRAAFHDVIRRSAEPKYHAYNAARADGKPLSPLDARPGEDLRERYLSFSERSLVAQSELLLDIQRDIGKLTAEHVARCGDRVRANRSNLPEDVRATLANDTEKEDLLRIIDYVSFEPRAGESVAALVRCREAAEASPTTVPPRAPHDTLTAAACAQRVPAPLTVLPPRSEKMAFVRSSLIDAASRVTPGFGKANLPRLQAPPSR
jgi:hypothetical protein